MKYLDDRIIEILSVKPELLTSLPEWMLSQRQIDEIRNTKRVAIAEIAGRDSIAAVLKACETEEIEAIVPTVAYTGTEYGNWEVSFEKIKIIKERLNVKVFNTIVLGSPKFWWKLCGRYTTHLFETYGFCSLCTGCHLYFHSVRIPLAKMLHSDLIIGGERESHDGKIKINQTSIALDSYSKLVKKFNITLLLPLRNIDSGQSVEQIIGQKWEEGEEQLECVLSKNYLDPDGNVTIHEESVQRFFDEFALPTAEEFIRDSLSKVNNQTS